jgi:hypothetical protein
MYKACMVLQMGVGGVMLFDGDQDDGFMMATAAAEAVQGFQYGSCDDIIHAMQGPIYDSSEFFSEGGSTFTTNIVSSQHYTY